MTSTVVIACFNGAKCIEAQLDSIAKQTIKPDEVIICDDNSSDNSYKIVCDYIAKNNLLNWKVIQNENNIGWKANFVNLVRMATKDIIFLCDQDDIWKENKVECMTKLLSSNPDIELLVSDLEVKYLTKNTQKYTVVPLGHKYYQHIRLKPAWLRIMRPGCSYAVRREFAQECFSKTWHEGLAHDLLLWQYAILRNAIGYVQEKLMIYQRFEESATNGVINSKIDFKITENQIFLESFEAALLGYQAMDKVSNRIINRSYALEKKRRDFFMNKSLILWLSCFKYIDCYPYKRSWLSDYVYMRKQI